MLWLLLVLGSVEACFEDVINVVTEALGDVPRIVYEANSAISGSVCNDTWSFLEAVTLSSNTLFIFSISGGCLSNLLHQVSATNFRFPN
jgi:hypothetical protein